MKPCCRAGGARPLYSPGLEREIFRRPQLQASPRGIRDPFWERRAVPRQCWPGRVVLRLGLASSLSNPVLTTLINCRAAPNAPRRSSRWPSPAPVLCPRLRLLRRLELCVPVTPPSRLRQASGLTPAVTPLATLAPAESTTARRPRRRCRRPLRVELGSPFARPVRELPDGPRLESPYATRGGRLHGVPPARRGTGAQCSIMFRPRPSRDREAFCGGVGLPADRPFLLYVCSALFGGSPSEAAFVIEWIRSVRASASPRLATAGILVRPHPARSADWDGRDLSGLADVAVWGANPVDAQSQADYFDSLHHSAAVVGLNTSAFIEAAIAGRPSTRSWRPSSTTTNGDAALPLPASDGGRLRSWRVTSRNTWPNSTTPGGWREPATSFVAASSGRRSRSCRDAGVRGCRRDGGGVGDARDAPDGALAPACVAAARWRRAVIDPSSSAGSFGARVRERRPTATVVAANERGVSRWRPSATPEGGACRSAPSAAGRGGRAPGPRARGTGRAAVARVRRRRRSGGPRAAERQHRTRRRRGPRPASVRSSVTSRQAQPATAPTAPAAIKPARLVTVSSSPARSRRAMRSFSQALHLLPNYDSALRSWPAAGTASTWQSR